MAFSTKRGRPKTIDQEEDKGTPELRAKRQRQLTEEVIDLFLRRGLIDEDQHWAAIHLRWLYTLKFGIPGVRAVDPADLGGIEHNNDDPLWREAREMEYKEAVTLLGEAHCLPILMRYAVFNIRPGFVDYDFTALQTREAKQRLASYADEIAALREGLSLLCTLWGRGEYYG